MDDRIGQQLGNYRLIRLLGEGGFAKVYLGEHIHLGTQAAIKVLHTQLGSEDASAFGTEAKTIAHLIHPNIVRVLEFGIEGKTPFLVMDFAPNGTLRQHHAKGTVLSAATILPYIKQTAAALQYAHDQKLIHRDIKPENMLLGRNNEVLLSDFGIALVAQSSRYQNTQDVVGTVAYMSPEQIQGKPRPSSDQYSLAVVAYEWLSGDRPFHGSFTELCTQHMFATPAPIRQKLPLVSPAIDQVLQTALAKDPHERFSSVQAFSDAFAQATKTGKVPNIAETVKRPPPPTERIAPPPPRTAYPPPVRRVEASSYGNYADPVSNPNYGSPSGNYAGPVSNPNYGYATSGSYAPRQTLPPNNPVWQQKQQRHPWRIGKRELLAALIGTIIFGICNYSLDLQFVNTYNTSNAPFLNPFYTFNINGISAGISPSIICGDLIFVIPLFLAVAYGPWVGMFVASIGGLLSDYFSHYLTIVGVGWNWYVGYAIIALIASIAYMRARGNNKIGTPAFSAIFWTIVGLVIGGGFISYCDAQIYHYPNFGWADFIYWTIPQPIVAIVALIITLAIYNSSVKSSSQRRGYP